MARILLGVTGGIAAYKALELARLATEAGHAVRVVQTPREPAFVGRASFEGITGAPVLVDEFEPRPGARRLPRRPAARPRPDLATSSSSRAADVLLHRAGARRTRSPSWPPGSPTTCSPRAALACPRRSCSPRR